MDLNINTNRVPGRLAAQAEQDALQRAQNSPANGIPLPGGVIAPLEAFAGIQGLPTRDHTKYLSDPGKHLMLKPTPGAKYVWASYDDKYGGERTSALVRSQRYRPVKKSEVDQTADFDMHFKTHTGTTDYVHWRDLILCEMSEEQAQAQYDGPIADYLRLLGALQDSYRSDVERASGGLAVAEVKQSLDPA